MDDATFDELPPRSKLAFALGVGSRLLGRDKLARYVSQIAPLVHDRVGHASVASPEQNYWAGIWQVYHAE